MEIPSLRARRRARIEIIPLIDVTFFLLATFVMVSLSMVQQRGITVQLPAASTGTAPEGEAHAVVTVDEAGGLRFDGEPVDPAGLAARRGILCVPWPASPTPSSTNCSPGRISSRWWADACR